MATTKHILKYNLLSPFMSMSKERTKERYLEENKLNKIYTQMTWMSFSYLFGITSRSLPNRIIKDNEI